MKGELLTTFEVHELSERPPDDFGEALVPLLQLLQRRILGRPVVRRRLSPLQTPRFRVHHLDIGYTPYFVTSEPEKRSK